MGPCMGFQAVAQWERIPPSLLEGENTDYLDIPDQPYRDGIWHKLYTQSKFELYT